MALEFIDSCAHSGTLLANQIPISRKWSSYSQSNYVVSPTRTSGGSIAVTGFIAKTLAYRSQRFFGMAYYYPSSSNGNINLMLMLSGGLPMAQVRIETDLSLSIYTGGNNNRIYNSGGQHLYITADVFHYFEFGVTLGGGTPINITCALSVDGQVFTSGASGNTGFNSTDTLINAAQMNQVQVSGPQGGGSTGYVTDIYVLNADTLDVNGNKTTLNQFLGDVAINALIPVSDVTIQWALQPSSNPNSYSLLHEIPPDDDTTYILTNTIGNKDTFLFQPLVGFSGTLLGAQLLIYAKKDAEGKRAIHGLVGGFTQSNNYGTDQYLYDYYDYFIFPLDTDNGVAWTPAIFNAENFGVLLSI